MRACNGCGNQLGFFGDDADLVGLDIIPAYEPAPEESFDWGGFFSNALNIAKQGVDVYASYERAQLPTGQTVYQQRSPQPIYTATATTKQASDLMKYALPVAAGVGIFLLARG